VTSARQFLLNVLGGKCDLCGSIERLHLHHKDRNRKNNDLSNIQLLCASCHYKIHSTSESSPKKRGHFRIKGSSGILTIPASVVKDKAFPLQDDYKVMVEIKEGM
jgi:5-methylcytosine-specific restriction endonuclease McrA